MKNRTKNILIGLGIFFALFFSVGGHFINKYYNEYIKSRPQMYCYQTFYGPPNPMLIIENSRYQEKYLEYYQLIELGDKAYIKFPLKTIPTTHPVYVLEYTVDSLLAKVVSYYKRGPQSGGSSFTSGWVYAKTLHKDPPRKKEKN